MQRQTQSIRQRARALAYAVLLVVSQALSAIVPACTPQIALAAGSLTITSAVQNTTETNPRIKNFRTSSGIAYCAQGYLKSPTPGQTLSYYGPLNIPELDYVLYHGYDADTVTSLGGLSAMQSERATALAVWLAIGEQRADVLTVTPGNTAVAPYHGNQYAQSRWDEAKDDAAKSAAWDLYQRALAYKRSGGGGVEAGTAVLWTNRTPDPDSSWGTPLFQSMVTPNKKTQIEVVKTSAQPAVTDGNAGYSLSGAVFGIYSDKDCRTLVQTLTCDQDGRAMSNPLTVGSYWVREIEAPAGYEPNPQVFATTPTGGRPSRVTVSDEPKMGTTKISVLKLDAETGEPVAQGNATLEGAEFTARFFPVGAAEAARTWVLRTDADGRAPLDQEHLVRGDAFYTDADGNIALPLGTLAVQETAAPEGYLLSDDSVHQVAITAADNGAVEVGAAPQVRDAVARGGVRVQKVDFDTGEPLPQGDASLAGAEFTVTNRSEKSVVVDGVSVAPGEDVGAALVTGESGVAESAPDWLPYGIYELRETKAPAGYHVEERWVQSFAIQADGAIVDLTTTPVEEPVVRGGVGAPKVDRDLSAPTAQGDATLAGALIEVTNASAASVVVGDVLYQPGDVVTTIETSADGSAATAADALPFGTYRLSESKAPEGYLLNEEWSATVEVREQGVSVVAAESLDDAVARGGVRVRKVDAESEKSVAQGDATLAGAEFTVFNASAAPVVVDGQTREQGEAVIVMATDADGVAQTSESVLPYGTYVVRETKAPEGYLPNPEWEEKFEVRADGAVVDLTADGHACAEQVTRRGITLQKLDAETSGTLALGAATLAGAQVDVVNASAAEVLVDGTWVAPGEVVATLTTDDEGRCATGERALPFGAYELRERVAPHGYERNEDWSKLVVVQEDGLLVSVEGPEHALADQVIRGDVCLVKADAQTGRRLAGVPFSITSLSTGESHVVVTDEDGTLSTSSEKAPHTLRTNANDAALGEDGRVDASLLDPDAGVWFCGQREPDGSGEVRDDLGALPFDSYALEELRCESNAGYDLVSTTFSVTESNLLELGVIENHPVQLATRLGVTETGDKLVEAGSSIGLTDVAWLQSLTPGQEYVLTGTLHLRDREGNDAGTLKRVDGTTVTGATTFVAREDTQTVEVPFEVDTRELGDQEIVAFEVLTSDDVTVAEHADISSEAQTVLVKRGPVSPLPKTGDALPIAAACVTVGGAAACACALAVARLRRHE